MSMTFWRTSLCKGAQNLGYCLEVEVWSGEFLKDGLVAAYGRWGGSTEKTVVQVVDPWSPLVGARQVSWNRVRGVLSAEEAEPRYRCRQVGHLGHIR